MHRLTTLLVTATLLLAACGGSPNSSPAAATLALRSWPAVEALAGGVTTVSDTFLGGALIQGIGQDEAGARADTIVFSDGTPEGTRLLLAGSLSGSAYSSETLIAEIDGTGYFLVNTADAEPQLYATDGTAAGTRLVDAFDDIRSKTNGRLSPTFLGTTRADISSPDGARALCIGLADLSTVDYSCYLPGLPIGPAARRQVLGFNALSTPGEGSDGTDDGRIPGIPNAYRVDGVLTIVASSPARAGVEVHFVTNVGYSDEVSTVTTNSTVEGAYASVYPVDDDTSDEAYGGGPLLIVTKSPTEDGLPPESFSLTLLTPESQISLLIDQPLDSFGLGTDDMPGFAIAATPDRGHYYVAASGSNGVSRLYTYSTEAWDRGLFEISTSEKAGAFTLHGLANGRLFATTGTTLAELNDGSALPIVEATLADAESVYVATPRLLSNGEIYVSTEPRSIPESGRYEPLWFYVSATGDVRVVRAPGLMTSGTGEARAFRDSLVVISGNLPVYDENGDIATPGENIPYQITAGAIEALELTTEATFELDPDYLFTVGGALLFEDALSSTDFRFVEVIIAE